MPPWTKSEDESFYAMAEQASGVRFCLMVAKAKVQGDRWEWSVWRAGSPEAWSRHGFGRSAVNAMRHAEDALRSSLSADETFGKHRAAHTASLDRWASSGMEQ